MDGGSSKEIVFQPIGNNFLFIALRRFCLSTIEVAQILKAEFTNEDRKAFSQAYRHILRLPSVETQTLEWFRFDTSYGWRSRFGWRNTNLDLIRNGFHLYVRGMLQQYGDRELWAFTIAKVEVPEKLQGRGWFRNYLEIAWRTMPHDAVVIEQVLNERLFNFLCRQPDYIRSHRSFLRIAPRGIGLCQAWPPGKNASCLPFGHPSTE